MKPGRLLLVSLILIVAVFDLALAFSTHWSTQFESSSDLNRWQTFKVGECGGQNHSVSGGVAHLRANYGTDCFGAFYRDNYNGSPGTFPTDQDVRVMWRWRYPSYGWYGSEAGQVSSAYGVAQYYGLSAVDSPVANYAHVESSGDWGSWDVEHPMWRSSARDTGWHVSTFDFICDGRQMDWWLDGAKFHHVGNGTVRPPNDPWRPSQFWFGNLITDVGADNSWTNHDLDYVYIYAVERPRLNTPSPGAGGNQTVSWQAVPNTPQPDGSSWGIEYQARACADANCASIVETSPWLSGTQHTFSDLPLQATYHYRVRARWVGTPELITCWGNTVSAEMRGEPNLVLAKSATVEQEPGELVQYSLIVQNSGDAPASGVVVRDPIPAYIVEPGSISGGGAVQGSEIVWQLGTLGSGQSRTLSWQGRIEPTLPGTIAQIVNVATASDSSGRSAQAEATTGLIRPQLSLSKTATPQVWPGGEIEYEITVRSIGSAPLRNLLIRDPLPEYVLDPTGVSHGGQLQGNDLVWNLDSLAPGETVVLSWQGRVDPATPAEQREILNRVVGAAVGGVSAEAEAKSLIIFPQVALGKTGPAQAAPGELIQYSLVVQNSGPAPAYEVTIVDPIPDYILDPANITGGGQVAGTEIIWEIGPLESGESRTLLWEGTVDLATPSTKTVIDNEAVVCEGSGRCSTTVFRTRLLKPSARLIKNAEPYGWPGRDLTYQIIVENTGETVLSEVVVRDPLPEYVLYPREISHGGEAVEYPFEGRIEMTWYLGDLAPGRRVELSWLGTVDPRIPVEEYAIRNQAFLETVQGLTRTAEGSSYILHPQVRVNKSATLEAGPGQLVEYTIQLENPSWAPAYEVEVHDPIPAYILNPANVTAGGQIRADEIYWSFEELAPGEVRILNWSGYVDPALPVTETQILNTVTVTDLTGKSDVAEAVTNLPAQQIYLYKSAPYRVYPGATIGYTVTLRNRSDTTLYELDIRDEVPEGVLEPGNISHQGRFEGNVEIVWEIGALAPGQVLELTWQGRVDPHLPREQGQLWNEVRLTSAGGLSAQARAKSFVEYPALILAKTATPQAGPGQVVSYSLTVENSGLAPAFGVEVFDPLPEYITDPIDISDSGVFDSVPTNGIRWQLDSLAPGERRELRWQGTVDPEVPLAQDQLLNTATAQDAGGLNASAGATTRVLKPGLALKKIAPVDVGPGEPLQYQLVVTNSGEMTLREVTVTDPLPPYVLSPANLSHGGLVDGNELRWNLGELARGQAVVLSWAGTIDPAIPLGLLEISNRARVTAWPGLDLEATASSAVRQPELLVVKQASSPVKPGDPVDYTIELVNQGSTTIHGLRVEDPIPAEVSPVEIHDGGYEVKGRIIWDTLGDLPPGQGLSLGWQARVKANISPEVAVITNVVQVSALGGLQREATATSQLLRPGLVVAKTASPSAYAGGPIQYTIRLSNNGPGLERQLEVRDPLPTYVTYVPDSANGYGQLTDDTVAWQLAELQPGQTVELRWRGQVALDLPGAATALTNEVRVWSLDTPLPITATAVTSLLEPGPTVQLLCPPVAQAGDRLAYTARIHNAGLGTLPEPTVRLPLPAGTHYLSGSATGNGRLLTGLRDEWGEPRPDELHWELETLAAGDREQLGFTLTASPVLTGQIESTLYLASGPDEVSQGRCQTALLVPSLEVTKKGPERATVNDRVDYELAVENSGPVMAYRTVLTDRLPPGLEYIPGSASEGGEVMTDEDAPATSLVWAVGDLAPGQTAIRRFQGQIHLPLQDSDGLKLRYSEQGELELVNIAHATAERAAPAWATTLTLVPRPVLSLTRRAAVEVQSGQVAVYTPVQDPSDGPIPALERSLADGSASLVRAALVRPGERISHTLTGANVGPGLARQAVLRDRAPADLIVLEDTISDGGYYDTAEHAVVWPLGDLPEAGGLERSYALLAPVGLRPELQRLDDNRGLISSPDAPTAYANARTEISGTFSLAGRKLATPWVEPGGQIDYTLQVHNTSPNLVGNVTIRDPLSEHVRYLAESASLPPVLADGDQTLVWNLGALAAGETREVRFSAQVDSLLPDWSDRLVNEAQIAFAGGSMRVRAVTMLPSDGEPAAVTPTAEPPTSDPGEPPAPPPVEPPATTRPPRPPVVGLLPLTPSLTAGPTATPSVPAPGLHKSVSAEVVEPGQVMPLTWRLTFSNPTPFPISGLIIRDLLPAGLLYVEGQSSHGRLTLSSRAASGETSALPTGQASVMATRVPTDNDSITDEQGFLPATPVAMTSSAVITTRRPLSVPLTITNLVSSTSPSSQSMPLTEVVVEIEMVPPAGRVEIMLGTLVLSDALPGTLYTNMATYAAANLDPGQSNEVTVLVRNKLPILPVTGGLLDPRTPQGRLTWSGTLLIISVGAFAWRRRRQGGAR